MVELERVPSFGTQEPKLLERLPRQHDVTLSRASMSLRFVVGKKNAPLSCRERLPWRRRADERSGNSSGSARLEPGGLVCAAHCWKEEEEEEEEKGGGG